MLAKPGAIAHWRQLAGPTDSNVARLDKPKSLRARFGVDGRLNAVHGSDSVASAEREIAFFFPAESRADADLSAPAAKQFLKAAPAATDSARSLHSVLVEGLTQLCRTKPDDVNAIRALGQWLLDNNPSAPRATNIGTGAGGGVAADASSSSSSSSSSLPKASGGGGGGGGGGASAAPRVPLVNNGAVVPLAELPPLNAVFLIGGLGSGREAIARNIVRDFGCVGVLAFWCLVAVQGESASDSE